MPYKDVVSNIPLWQGKKIKAVPLSGGLTNINYKIDVDGESFVLRITEKKSELLGIDREGEHHINSIVAELGIAPEVVHFVESQGHLVTQFIDGKPLSFDEIRENENIQRIASALQKFHKLPEVPWTFCAFRITDEYQQVAEKHSVDFPEDFPWILEEKQKIEKALSRNSQNLALCHNDLLNGNFLDDGEIRIIDWEYAGMGDAFFDLANFSTHHEFDKDHDRVLLESYFERETKNQDVARHNLMKIMSDFREAMWAQVQKGISHLDFDYHEYADKYFSRMRERIDDDNYEQYLLVC